MGDAQGMEPYRMLAQMTHQAYQRGDDALATLFARILERLWDNCLPELRATPSTNWKQIDANMGRFINPILQYARGRARRPDPAEEIAAYEACQNALTRS